MVIKSNDPATKKDLEVTKLELQKEIAEVKRDIIQMEVRLVRWVLGISTSSVIILCGAMFTMFKLMIHT